MVKHCIGLDVGRATIKLVQLRAESAGLVLQNFALEPVQAQGAEASEEELVVQLKALFKRIDLKGKHVALALSGSQVMLRRLSLPALDKSALAEQMEWEAQNQVPFPRDEIIVDYQVLNAGGSGDTMDVLFVAGKREAAEQAVEIVAKAGLKPHTVDSAALALFNAAELLLEDTREPSVVLVDIGAEHTTLVLVVYGQFVAHRDITLGGNAYVQTISERLGCTAKEAWGYVNEQSAPVDKQTAFHEGMTYVSQKLAAQIARTLHMWTHDGVLDRAERIYVAGGCAVNYELMQAIEVQARVPACALNPFDALQVDVRRFDVAYLKQFGKVAAVALGLARRRMDKDS